MTQNDTNKQKLSQKAKKKVHCPGSSLIKDKKKIKEEEEIKAWEEKIKNFTPESLMTVKVDKSKYEIFYEEITVVPTKIVLAFYVHDEDSKIDFEVYSPTQKMIKKIKAKNRGFAELEIKVAGAYEFHINNERVLTKLNKYLLLVQNRKKSNFCFKHWRE